jgi:hypothetical protein
VLANLLLLQLLPCTRSSCSTAHNLHAMVVRTR